MKSLFFIFILLINTTVFAQNQEEIIVSKYDKNVKSGHYFSVFFELKIHPSKELKPQLFLPENWQILIHKAQIIDSSSKRYFYTVSIPKNTHSGKFVILFEPYENENSNKGKSIFINVEEFKKIEITNVSKPEYVMEGDSLETEFLVQNLGNSIEKVNLSTSQGFIVDKSEFHILRPNSSLQVFVKQKIPVTGNNSWEVSADLKLISYSSKMTAHETVSVPVYSNSSKKIDVYKRLPIEAGASFLNFNMGNQSVIAYQYLISGNGFLDFKEKHHLDFIVRGPNEFQLPTIGTYDQYTFEYKYKDSTKISLGDYINKVSDLLEFSRFGRGLKFEKKFAKSSFNAFYQKARFQPSQKDAFGGNYSYFPKENLKLGFNYINKGITVKDQYFRTNIISFSSEISNKNLNIETELALGNHNSILDFGILNRLNYNYKKFNFNSEFINAGKEFQGFYNNSRLLINGLNYQISRKLNIGINSNFTRINPSLDLTNFSTSPVSSVNMVFLSYSPSSSHMFFLNYSKQEREDRATPSSFHFKEDFGNLTYNLNKTKFLLSAQGRYGNAQNLLAGDQAIPRKTYSSMTQPSVRILKWFWINGYFEHQHTNKFSTDNTIQDLLFYGGGLKINYGQKINLSFMYRNNYAPDEFFQKRSFIDASLSFDFKKHSLSMNSGSAFIPFGAISPEAAAQNTLFFSLKYVLKLNVPTMKNRNIGHMKGQIMGINTKLPKNGVLIQMGQYKTLSDSLGNFQFSNLKPDNYYLTLPSSPDLAGLLPNIKCPIPIKIAVDSTSFIKIEMVKTGGVEGKINFVISDRLKSLSNGEIAKNVMVKLYNDSESLLTIINDKGDFSFKEIKPGTWKLLAILPASLEKFEVLEKEKSITIESDLLLKEHFTVKSTERKIIFSDKDFKVSLKK